MRHGRGWPREILRKMGEPAETRHYLEAGQLKTLACHKVYHLNFISRYRSIEPEKNKLDRHLRLVLNREGIKRVEHMQV